MKYAKQRIALKIRYPSVLNGMRIDKSKVFDGCLPVEYNEGSMSNSDLFFYQNVNYFARVIQKRN